MRPPRKLPLCFAVSVWAVLLAINAIAVLAPACRAEESADGKGVVAVDYTTLARRLVRSPHNPVLKVGEKGTWNDQTLSCFTVLVDGDTFRLYTGGCQHGQEKQIGLATSPDGIHWAYYQENPLFTGDMPHALKVEDTYRLYYPGRDDTAADGLLMRTSPDGFVWSKPTLVMPGGVLDPCVIRVSADRYHLYYCDGGRVTKGGKQVWEFKNYLAVSGDGIQWPKQRQQLLPLGPEGSWDSQSHAGPCVLKLEDGFHLWYLGSGPHGGKTAWRIGHATSPDGVKWTRSREEPVLDIGKPGDWDGGTFLHFDIVLRDEKFLFWYAAAPTEHGDEKKMTTQIGHGTSR